MFFAPTQHHHDHMDDVVLEVNPERTLCPVQCRHISPNIGCFLSGVSSIVMDGQICRCPCWLCGCIDGCGDFGSVVSLSLIMIKRYQ